MGKTQQWYDFKQLLAELETIDCKMIPCVEAGLPYKEFEKYYWISGAPKGNFKPAYLYLR